MRPKDYDPREPDPLEYRCSKCNPGGFNRTGITPLGYLGSSTTSMYGKICENDCIDGWKEAVK